MSEAFLEWTKKFKADVTYRFVFKDVTRERLDKCRMDVGMRKNIFSQHKK